VDAGRTDRAGIGHPLIERFRVTAD
jgi:hypothetical protein